MHLEGEGVFPWGPGHVSLSYLVSEDPIQTLALSGGGVGRYGMQDHEHNQACPFRIHVVGVCLHIPVYA